MHKINQVAATTATPLWLVLLLMMSFGISGHLSMSPETTEIQFIIKLDFRSNLPGEGE